ncbi:hypothetical protein JF535_02665 [Microbulbifer salipaludis]|uniref:Glycosyl transferase family 2 n=1 Tax=Microbulbifer salipaludis TaxID=187980 RepID=A0ABS3E398_9GAMM|nr:hypothetical protein [Microbulbifer salipaludis]MBN8429747.1 hypothetical protein [Microbulbifer salipaludis]
MDGKQVKIGILVVYYLDPAEEWVIQEHFRRLEACYKNQFKIYAACNRLAPDLWHYLSGREYIEAVPVVDTDLRGSQEHIWYLDQLKTVALEDGCDYICTLDVDSWPITGNVFDRALALLEEHNVDLMAIQREENGDTYLPHPSFIFASAQLFRNLDLRFGAPSSDADTREFHRFSEVTKQPFDTGIGVGYKLWEHEIPWLKLLRSNTVDYHFLMGGVYGGLIFHMGSSSRVKRFRAEGRHWTKKFGEWLASVPLISRQAKRIVFWLEKVFPDRLAKRNMLLYQAIRRDLKNNSASFYDELQGLPGSPDPATARVGVGRGLQQRHESTGKRSPRPLELVR